MFELMGAALIRLRPLSFGVSKPASIRLAAAVGRNNQRALRRKFEIKTSGAMRYAYCTLAGYSVFKHTENPLHMKFTHCVQRLPLELHDSVAYLNERLSAEHEKSLLSHTFEIRQ